MRRASGAIVAAVLVGVVAGCATGPAYHRPEVPTSAAFKETPPPDSNLEVAWKSAQPQDDQISAKWWELFHDETLNSLEEQVATANQQIAQADAAFRSARAALRVTRADLFPDVTATASADRELPSATRSSVTRPGGNGVADDFQVHGDVSYEVDAWGRVRNNIRAGIATVQATAADMQTLLLSLHADLASDYFQLRGVDAQDRLLRSTVDAYQRALDLTTNRYNQGVASGGDVAQAETQLEVAKAQAIDLGIQRATLEHAIAILTGRPPAAVAIAAVDTTWTPPAIPVALPAELVQRRPDVAAAERRAAAANAQIGVAHAAYFPTLTLTGSAGLDSAALTTLFSWPSRIWAIGASLVGTIFDGGRRRGMTEQAQANYEGTVAAYRQSVLTAFQDVEDSLASLRVLADESVQQGAAVRAAERSLTIANNRYQGGITDYLEVVTAQNTAFANERTEVDIVTRQLTESVLLIKALGGGWTQADLPKVR